MMYWAVVFLIEALVAGSFAFGGTAPSAVAVSLILFFVFLAAFVATAAMSIVAARSNR